MIVKSFKNCSISNAMNGSEDDLFGQDKKEKEIDQNEREVIDINSGSADELDELEDDDEL